MRKRWPIIAVLVMALGAALAYAYLRNRSAEDRGVIEISGNIEVTQVEVSFRLAGWVVERSVEEGETVAAGQLVARLDDGELTQGVALRASEVQAAEAELAALVAGSRPEEIAQTVAAVAKAQAQLDELLAGSRPEEVAVAEAAVGRADAEMARLKAEYERQEKLLAERVVSPEARDAARAAFLSAQAQLREAQARLKLVREGPRQEQINQARADLDRVQQALTLARKGPRQETKDQARANLQRARAALALAQTQKGYALLTSPIGGVVLSKNVEAGEYVVAGIPVVTVGDLANVWLRGYVNETDLGRVKLGQPVRVTTDTYPGKVYQGRLAFIASEAEFTPKNIETRAERVKLVYRVKVDVPNPAMELKPGMPADAVILVEPVGGEVRH